MSASDHMKAEGRSRQLAIVPNLAEENRLQLAERCPYAKKICYQQPCLKEIGGAFVCFAC